MICYFKKIQIVFGKAFDFFNFSLSIAQTICAAILIIACSLTSIPLSASEKDPHKPFNWMNRLTSLFSNKFVEKEILSVVTIKNHKSVGFVVQDDKTGKFILVTAFDAIENVNSFNLHFMNQGKLLKVKKVWSISMEQNVISFELEDYVGHFLKLANSPDYNSDEVYIPGHPDAYFSDIKGPGLHNESSPIFGIISDETVDSPKTGGGPVLNNKGEIMGMYLTEDVTAPGIYFALKIEHIENLLKNPEISIGKLDAFFTNSSFEKKIEILRLLFSRPIYSRHIHNFYFNKGTDVTEHFSGEAFSRLKDIAEKGSANAQFKVGSQLYYDDGVPSNKEQAAFWFGQAAGQEHHRGAKMLEILREDEPQLRQAIEKGWTVGTYLLAQKLYKGNGILQDKEKAAQNFRAVALANFIFEETRQYSESIDVLNEIDEDGFIRFQEYLNRKEIYHRFIFTFPYQYESAFQLAMMLYKGEGVSQNKRRAFMWLSRILISNRILLNQMSQVMSQETDNDLEDELLERFIDTGENGLEELIETAADENRFKELMKIAQKQSQMEESIKIQKEINEIVFAARHKMIAMLNTGDGILLNKKIADRLLDSYDQRVVTQQEWDYITEPDNITEMKQRIKEVKNSIIPETDARKRAEMLKKKVQVIEDIERITQGRQFKEDESTSSSCGNKFRNNTKGPPREIQ